AIDPADGTINPNINDNIPGLEALRTADLMVIFTRFRALPDEQMKYVADYVAAGRPIVGLRTATHAFNFKGGDSPYARWSWNSKSWAGGFGKQGLGAPWRAPRAGRDTTSGRGYPPPRGEGPPTRRGPRPGAVGAPPAVSGAPRPLPGDSHPLLLGGVLGGMQPPAPPVAGKPNDPM